MSLKDFEDRMLKLKGVKLPAISAIGVDSEDKLGRKPMSIDNTLVGTLNTSADKLVDVEYQRDEALDDILVGIVRSFDVAGSHKGYKLSKAVVKSILDRLDVISTDTIMANYNYSKRQAQYYVQACRLVSLFYTRHNIKQSLAWLSKFSN